ncbi:MAG TPA: hypothetical protein VG734_02205 [Lacunisphaera sp.]|nr:hypothetical protein [Lacunisphaera sp.]
MKNTSISVLPLSAPPGTAHHTATAVAVSAGGKRFPGWPSTVAPRKRLALVWSIALVAIALSPLSRADIYTVRRQGAGVVPLKSEEISMEAEVVYLRPNDFGYDVEATFEMRNHTDRQVACEVAFPILGSSYRGYNDLGREFHVKIKPGGEADSAFQNVKVTLKPGAPRKPGDDYLFREPPKTVGDYPEAVVWDVTWAPKQTKVVRVSFDMGEPMVLPGSNHLAAGWQWTYIVTTGSLWKGPIGRADISMQVGHPFASHAPLPAFRQVSYPDQAKWQGGNFVSWHFENWTPTTEIWLRTAEWTGLKTANVPDYQFALPADYHGAKVEYRESTIEELVARDLGFAAKYFPAEARAFDRNLLRIAIADWLLHEIYARHGDSFRLRRAADNGSTKPHEIEDGDGYLYSGCRELFFGYGYHGGWYKPLHPVKTSALSPLERRNVIFLRNYLDQLRAKPEYRVLMENAHVPGAENLGEP